MNRTLRLLGIITLICAPALHLEAARHGFQRVANENTDVVGAILYGLFSVGWLAGMVGLRQLSATGRGVVGRAVVTLPIATIGLALGQTLMDLLHVPTGNPLYAITDLAWPLSMVLTFVVGVAALLARTLPLWGRLVLAFCGLSLPVTIVLGVLHVELPGDLFGWHTTLGWALWGLLLIASSARDRAAQPVLAG